MDEPFVDTPKTRYHLKSIPCPVVPRTDKNASDMSVVKWSGRFPIPQIGDEVTVNMNGLGPGTVIGYFIEYGYLGLYVKLFERPEWHIRQTTNDYCMPFGIDLG
jgi:hypothetical protein